ncbi:MAG: hypothetical protein CMH60_00265 [Myxococcales bacterium]|nr:hypothetical protein [Myxococcales bacterium]
MQKSGPGSKCTKSDRIFCAYAQQKHMRTHRQILKLLFLQGYFFMPDHGTAPAMTFDNIVKLTQSGA